MMKAIRSRITRGGQITLPAEVRRLLGLQPQDEVQFNLDIEDRTVTITRPKYTLESVAGSVGPPTRTEDIDRMIREAQDEGYAKKYGR